jgi:hypothetical protein
MVILRLAVVSTAGFSESVTAIVKSKAPVALGVPEIWPVMLLRLRPAGSAPVVMLQL